MDTKQWDDFGNALSVVLLVAMLVILLIMLCASNASSQVPAPPLPPDILHVSQRGCHIDGHDAGSAIDAKTGEEIRNVLWTVTPFAKYADRRTFVLPDGTVSDEWRPANKDGTDRWIASYSGTSDFIPREATDACSGWMRTLDQAKRKAMHEAAHEVVKK